MSSDGLRAFLNTKGKAAGVPLVKPFNPVNWGRLGKAIVGGIVGSISLGTFQIWDGIADGANSILTGSSEFITDGIDAVFTPLTTAVEGAWTISLDQWGLLALPLAVAITLASLWFIARAFAYIREEGL